MPIIFAITPPAAAARRREREAARPRNTLMMKDMPLATQITRHIVHAARCRFAATLAYQRLIRLYLSYDDTMANIGRQPARQAMP